MLVEIGCEYYKEGILKEAKRIYKRFIDLLTFSKYKGEKGYFNYLYDFLKKNKNNVYSFLSDINKVIDIEYINNPLISYKEDYLKDEDVILLLNDIKEDVMNTFKRYKEYW